MIKNLKVKSKKAKVYVALSGGVDSAVSAALLKRQGHDVVGVHMKLWQPPVQISSCSWQQDLEAAKEVTEYLEIPFEVWDFTKQYQNEVVEYLFSEHQAGRTPNPDVMCNRHIKFGLFYDQAVARGADFIATGHYARTACPTSNNEFNRITNNHGLKKVNIRDGLCQLLRGSDPNKDQSYFLWAVDRNKLPKIVFPVGAMQKTQVRQLAKKFGLPNAERKDSQGICFVGKVDLPEFLKLRIPAQVGEVVTTAGQPVSQHQGAWYYTIGQRRGFGGGGGNPYYVAAKDPATNRLMVAPRTDQALYATQATVGSLNWLVDLKQFSIFNFQFSIQTRYRQQAVKARIAKDDKGGQGVRVRFAEPVWALAPGQSMVFYDKDLLIGGGIIEARA